METFNQSNIINKNKIKKSVVSSQKIKKSIVSSKKIEKSPVVSSEYTIDSIVCRINKEICYDTLSELTDENLLNMYKECKSVKKAINTLENILYKYLDNETVNKISKDYLLKLIPPGTKGVCRGNKFNEIVKDFIHKIKLSTERFEVCFEKKCKIGEQFTPEIPDWYILEKSTNKIIIGMNQLALWGGGHQSNRGSKYIQENKYNNENVKLLCVVCNNV